MCPQLAGSRVLDLDCPGSWDPAFAALVYAEQTWAEVKTRMGVGEDTSFEFLSQVRYSEQDALARRLRGQAVDVLVQKHSFVAAYHGCRPRDVRAYEEKGIQPSDPQALIDWSRDLFTGIDGFERALRDLTPMYVGHNQGKVGLLISGTWAKKHRSDYVKGSELVGGLANRLGREAKLRVVETGRPTLIKCAIPVDWLDIHTTFPMRGGYASEVIAQLIRRRAWPHREYDGCEDGYLLTRGVPPENIIEFIDMTEFCDDMQWVEEPRVIPSHLRGQEMPDSSGDTSLGC
jgi:hypothetical protein